MRLRIARPVKIGFLALAIAGGMEMSRLWADTPPTEPTTQPAVKAGNADAAPKPSKPKANITPEAQAELDALTKAYGELKSLELTGSMNFDADIDGEAQKKSSPFKGSFAAPNQFKHEMKEDLVVGSTGEKQYLFVPKRKLYITAKAAQTRADFSKSPSRASAAIGQQNPGLLFALSENAATALLTDATDVSKLPDEKIGQQSFTALNVKKPRNEQVVLIDSSTHLVRQIRVDIAKTLAADGAPNVKSATLTFDYGTVTPNADVKPEQFAWTPPEGALDAAKMKDPGDSAVQAMVGKPAPDFTLKGMDDKDVSLKDLKGSVVVIDFWATWCPPCRKGLPHLDKLYQDNKEAGLKVFALNQREEKDKVSEFITKTKLAIPVLLDSEGETGEAYKVNGIPQTVLIGKDGLVKKVIVGFDPESNELEQAVEEELKAK